MNKVTKIIIGIVVLAVLVFGYKNYSNKKANVSVETVKEPVKIGAILPLSGMGATYGEDIKDGISLAINELENPQSFSVIYEDSQAQAGLAVTAAQKLVSVDKVMAIIGPLTSQEALAVASVTEKEKTVLMIPTAPHKAITNVGDYVFRIYPSDIGRTKKLADFTANTLKAGKVGVLNKKDEFGQSFSDEYITNLKKMNFAESQIHQESFSPLSPEVMPDFRTQLMLLKKFNPEVVVLVAHFKELAFILKQSDEIGFHPQFLTTADIENPEVIKIAGKASDGVIYGATFYNPASADSVVKSFVERYQAKYKKDPSFTAALGYDAARVIFNSIKNIDKTNQLVTSDLLRDNLYLTQNFPGVAGNITFDANGDVLKEWGLKTIKDGKFAPLEITN